MTTTTLRAGVIGVGWMGRLHARSYRQIVERFPDLKTKVELAVACDGTEAGRRAGLEECGFSRAVSDYRELIEDPDIDLVSICAPNYLHKEIALAAAEAGKPFWIEKPMGVNAQESRDIAEAAQRAGIQTSVGFNYRHTPAIEKMREMVQSGQLGRITNVRVWFLADYANDPKGPLTWRYDRERAGAGVLSDLLSHGADLVQYVAGRISKVTALSRTLITERPIPTKVGVGHTGWEVSDETGPVENEDYAAFLFELDGGAVGTLESSRVSVGPRAEYVVEVYGTEGSARWNFEHLNDLYVCLGTSNEFQGYTRVMASNTFKNFARFQPSAGTSMGFDDMKAIEAGLFVEAILTGRQVAPSVGDGWSAAEIIEAGLRSIESGAWQDVPVVEGTTFGEGR